jgi:uncharacterized membrane protein
MLKASRILVIIGVALFLLGIYLMFQYPSADCKRAIAVILVVGGPVLMLLSGWIFQIDRENKLDK